MRENIVMIGASSGFGAVTARARDGRAMAATAALTMAYRPVSAGASTGATKGADLIDRPESPRLAVWESRPDARGGSR
jgi:hypothetical protein